MPIPEPSDSELSKHDKGQSFVSRCMGDSVMNKEFPDQRQRSAVCFSQYRKAQKKRAKAGLRVDFSNKLEKFLKDHEDKK